MSVQRKIDLFDKEFFCKTDDLSEGLPPEEDNNGNNFPDGALIYVVDDDSHKISKTYKRIFDAWYEM